jgi:molybdopterin-guanine dinucleotide biosynthesis protein B
MSVTPIVCIVGRSGVGKTTLLEKLIPALKRRGYRVATVKHHAHSGLEIDQPGKDSWRHVRAGSDHVVVVAPDKIVSIRPTDHESALDEVATTIRDVDIILVEGYKQAAKPKIEVTPRAVGAQPTESVCAPDELLAVVSPGTAPFPDVPQFGPDDVCGLADLIGARLLS